MEEKWKHHKFKQRINAIAGSYFNYLVNVSKYVIPDPSCQILEKLWIIQYTWTPSPPADIF